MSAREPKNYSSKKQGHKVDCGKVKNEIKKLEKKFSSLEHRTKILIVGGVLALLLVGGIAANNALNTDNFQSSDYEGLVAEYRFDTGAGNTAYDTSNGNNGNIDGAKWVKGIQGEALRFKSSKDDRVAHDTISFNDQEAHTYSTWVKWEGGEQTNRYILPFGGAGSVSSTIYFSHNSGTDDPLFRYRNANGDRFTVLEDHNWFDGRWHHIVWVTDSDRNLKVYADGELLNETTVSSNSIEYNSIGLGYSDNSYDWDGKIDESKIFSEALNESQIKSLYNQGAWRLDATGKKNGPSKIIDINFQHQNSSHVFDSSTPEYHGKPNGTSQETAVNCKVGRCYSFDGNDDYIALDKRYDSQGAIEETTVCSWYKSNSLSDNGANYIASFDRSEYWSFAADDGDGRVHFSSTDSSGTTHDMRYGGEALTDGEWHHICAWFNSSGSPDKKIIVDGNVVTSASVHGGNNLGTGTTRYGFLGAGSEATSFNDIGAGCYDGPCFKGKMDQFKIYDKALTREKIVQQTEGLSSDGAVLDMRFTEGGGDKVHDFSSEANHGTLYPNETAGPSWETSKYGSTIGFDGVNDYLTVSDDSSFDLGYGDVAWAFWMKPKDVDSTGRIFMKRDAWEDHEISSYVSSGKINFRILDSGNGNDDITLSSPVDENKWYHVVGLRKNDELRLYVNGKLKDTGTGRGDITSSADVQIGRRSGTAQMFEGKIHTLKAFPNDISESKIQQLYRKGKSQVGYHKESLGDLKDGLVLSQTFDRVETCGQSDTVNCPSGVSGKVSVDESGKAKHGQFVNDPVQESTNECRVGRCLGFDGSDDYINITRDLGDPNGMTLSVWFKTPDTNTGSSYLLDGRNGGNWWFIQDYNECGGKTTNKGNLCYENRVAVDPSDIQKNNWHHVVVTDNPDESRIYLDGELKDVGDGSDPDIGQGMHIGARYSESSYFKGKIDEVRVHNSTLSEKEIWDIYTKGRDRSSEGEISGPAGWWRLDEETSVVGDEKDYSSNLGMNGNGQTVSVSEITFDNSGWYKIHYAASWKSETAYSRHVMRNWLRKNGGPEIIPSETRCYIRLASGSGDSCSNEGVALVKASEGDQVELMGTKFHGESGETVTVKDNYLNAEKVSNPIAQVYDSSGGQNYDSGAITVNLDSSTKTDSIYDFDSSNDYIRVDEKGWYRAYYSINNNDTNQGNRQTVHSWLRLNGGAAPANPADSYSYVRNSGSGDQNHQTGTALLNLSSNDYLQLRQEKWVKQSSGESVTMPDKNWLILEKIEPGNVLQVREPEEQRVNNGATNTVQFSEVDVEGERYDYLGQGEIAVNETGWYEISYNLNWDDEASNDRHNVYSWMERNGEKLRSTEQVDYTRGYSGGRGNSNTVSNIHKFEEGDVLELRVRPEGGYIDVFANSSLTLTPVQRAPDSASENHGVPYGDPKWVKNERRKSLKFDGEDDSVKVSDSDVLSPSKEVTVSAWVKQDGNTSANNQRITDKGGAVTYWVANDGVTCLRLTATRGGDSPQTCFSTHIKKDEWSHLAFTYDSGGGRVKLYVNGDLFDTSSYYSGEMSGNTADLVIGNRNGEDRPWNGSIDDVRIYPYALNQEQVKQVMNGGAASIR